MTSLTQLAPLHVVRDRSIVGAANEPAALAQFRAKRRDPIAMQHALGDRFLSIIAYVNGEPAASAIVLPAARSNA